MREERSWHIADDEALAEHQAESKPRGKIRLLIANTLKGSIVAPLLACNPKGGYFPETESATSLTNSGTDTDMATDTSSTGSSATSGTSNTSGTNSGPGTSSTGAAATSSTGGTTGGTGGTTAATGTTGGSDTDGGDTTGTGTDSAGAAPPADAKAKSIAAEPESK